MKHPVAAVDGPLRVLVRGVQVGPANQGGEQGRLRQGQALDVLVEVGVRGFSKPVDGKTSALTEIRLVGVEFKNLPLAQALLHEQGQEDLLQLARQSLAPREEEGPRQLHGQRAAALSALVGADIRDGGAKNAIEADAVVGEKAVVLGGQHRVHTVLRQVVVPHEAPLGAALIEERGDDFRLEPVALKRTAVLERTDRGQLPLVELEDSRSFPDWSALEKRSRTRANLQPVASDPVAAEAGRALAFAVKRLAQARRDPFRGPRLPDADGGRRREHHRGVVEDLAAHPFVDQARKMEIEVGKESGPGKNHKEPGHQNRPLPARHPEDPRQPLAGS